MKPLAFLFAIFLLPVVTSLRLQGTTVRHRRSMQELFSGRQPALDATNTITSNRPREERMEDLQIRALTQMMEAVNAGDARRYASLYSQDAVITIYGGDELKGRDAI